MQYVWFIWSLIILALWAVIFFSKKGNRKEMLKMSLITMPFGLTEPLFVPEYWMPPSLFHLAERTGFDIESLIFSFAIGGIGTVLYNLIFKKGYIDMPHTERSHQRHKLHIYLLFVPAIVFVIFSLFTTLNHIYCGIIVFWWFGNIVLSPRFKRKDMGWRNLVYHTVLHLFRKHPSVLSAICGAVLESGQPDPYSCSRNSN